MSVRLDNVEPVDIRPIRRALISVYDKSGLTELARVLARHNVDIVSTGSTATRIAQAGVPVTRVDDVTGFPEVLEGRVKTLHPAIHAGILADQRKGEHRDQLSELGIRAFDLVVCNLYPFEETVISGASFDESVEQIDIGGPSMVRAAAKNHPSVAVVTSPERYGDIEVALAEGGFTLDERRDLAAEAFTHTATYDLAIAEWFATELGRTDLDDELDAWFMARIGDDDEWDEAVGAAWEDALSDDEGMPEIFADVFERTASLRYGENPHQSAAVYREVAGVEDLEDVDEPIFEEHLVFADDDDEAEDHGGIARVRGESLPDLESVSNHDEDTELEAVAGEQAPGIANAIQLHGKAMSYNNYTDGDAALRAAYDHTEPCVAIIKHANPCGIAIADTIAHAHLRAHACDPVSAFGGVIAANREVTVEMAHQVVPIFTEVILAPSYEDGAVEILAQKKNLRVLHVVAPERAGMEFRQISGGLLLQSGDAVDAPGDDPENWTLVAGQAADQELLRDLEFAWRSVRSVRSNAILLAKDGASVGIGMGQVNRVDSCTLAVERANTLGARSTGDAGAGVDSAGGARLSDVVADAPEHRSVGAVAASDAFFPFADGLQVLIDAGVRAVVLQC